jgi:NitT/TauT family transport system substrate-binding protein
MRIEKLAIAGIATTLMAAGTLAAHAEPLIIAYPVWVGYGPLFVAQEKGFFANEGVKVHMFRTDIIGHGVWDQ